MQIRKLQEEIGFKDAMLDEFDKSSVHDTTIRNSTAVHRNPNEVADLRNLVQERTKKCEELESLLDQQTDKYLMEKQKSDHVMAEVKRLREQKENLME